MHVSRILQLAGPFFRDYDAGSKDRVWKKQSAAFRKFWDGRIRNASGPPLTDEECDAIIRILDRNGKGNTRSSEAVAKAMVPQGAWRRMFGEFRENGELANLLTSIFQAKERSVRAKWIDQLYTTNEGRKNNLTGGSGNTVNAFLAAYEPAGNLSIISLKDRRTLMEFLGVEACFDWETASIGTRMVESNECLFNAFKTAGFAGSARAISVFCYWKEFKELWKHEHTANRVDEKVTVTVPSKVDVEEPSETKPEEIRESLQIQAMLAEVGARMGLSIWLPKSDRARVLSKWKAREGELLDSLPLSYDAATVKTIQEIDVLWLRRRTIVRAFEVEHTTSVYSGLLRMADLIALQPNLAINLHIVAPAERRDKVFEEIQRPVFSLLEGRALSAMCTYLSYESVRGLAEQKHLEHLSDSVIEDYAESAES